MSKPRRWYKSGWRPCSKTCGRGIQLRKIVCRRKVTENLHETVKDSLCVEEKPTGILQQECNKVPCPAEWKPMAWSEVGVPQFASLNKKCPAVRVRLIGT